MTKEILPWEEGPVSVDAEAAAPTPTNENWRVVKDALVNAGVDDYEAHMRAKMPKLYENSPSTDIIDAGSRITADIDDLHGGDVTQEDIEAIPAPSDEDMRAAPEGLIALYAPPQQPIDPLWRSRLKNEKGFNYRDGDKVDGQSIANIELFIRHHEDYAGMFMYDEFAHEKKVCRCPPWEDESKFWPHTLRDEDITGLCVDLHKKGLPCNNTGHVRLVLDLVVKGWSRHPAREYFGSIKWDGKPRLDNWLVNYCGATKDDPRYLQAVGSKWLIAAVKRVFEPGCKFDHILVLEGLQDTGKSLLLKELATIRERAYFDDTIRVKDMGNPATVPKMQGVLIIEFAEMSGFRDKDVNELKQQITITNDRIVRKYANEATYYPRQFVFAGSTNNSHYLHDATGNRRFWPVYCKKINIEALKQDKEQLWAEAVVRYEEGEKLYLEGDLKLLAQAEQEKRRTLDPWFEPIEKLCEGKNFVTSEDLFILCVPEKSKQSAHVQDRIASVMIMLGYERTQNRLDGQRVRGWKKIGWQPTPQAEQEEIAWPV